MGRFFSLISTMAFVFVMIRIPLVAVFGVPEINPPFKELGEQIKTTAMNKVRQSLSGRESTNDPDSPLYGLDSPAQSETSRDEASPWGQHRASTKSIDQPSAFVDKDQLATSPLQRDNRLLTASPALYENREPAGNKVPGTSHEEPPLMKSLLNQQHPTTHNSQTAKGTPGAFNRIQPSKYVEQVSAQQESRSSLTFTEATLILKDLGITNYRLEPGAKPDQFYFVCFYQTPQNPSVITRFEAEAMDPMLAVENVLVQIRQATSPKQPGTLPPLQNNQFNTLR